VDDITSSAHDIIITTQDKVILYTLFLCYYCFHWTYSHPPFAPDDRTTARVVIQTPLQSITTMKKKRGNSKKKLNNEFIGLAEESIPSKSNSVATIEKKSSYVRFF
jgi:hypothetical protein